MSSLTDYAKLTGTTIVAFGFASRDSNAYVTPTKVSIQSLTYEKHEPITNFNKLISNNEYLLADFSVNGYYNYLSATLTNKFVLGENALNIAMTGYTNTNYVKYTLPEALDISEIETINVTYNSQCNPFYLMFFDEQGNQTYNWTSGNVANDTTIASTGYSALSGTKIVAIGFSSNDSSLTQSTPKNINIKKISYIKKAASN